jgi:hypothetical protein
MNELESATELTEGVFKRMTDLTLQNIALSQKLKIALDALESLRMKYDKSGQVADTALTRIRGIKSDF